MIEGRLKKFKIPFDNRIETFMEEDHRLKKNEYLFGMKIDDMHMMTVDVDLLIEYFDFINESYSNIMLILCQEGFDMFFNYVRLLNAVGSKDQEKIFNCITVLTEKSADIFKNYSKCVRQDFAKHKKDLEESGNGNGNNTRNQDKNNNKDPIKQNRPSTSNRKSKLVDDLETTTDEEVQTPKEVSHMKSVFLKNSIMKLVVTCLDKNMMEYSASDRNRGCNVLDIKEYIISYFHVLTFLFMNMFNLCYSKYFEKKPKLEFLGAGQRGRKKQKKTLDEDTCLNLKNMNTLLNNIILLVCSVDFHVLYDKINIIILDLYLEFFLNVYFLNQECNNTFNMDIYYDSLADVIFNLLKLYVKRDREEILSDLPYDIELAGKNMPSNKELTNKTLDGKENREENTDLSHLRPVVLEYISYSFSDVYVEICKKCSNVRMADAILMLRNTNLPAEIMRELYRYIKKNAPHCVTASAQSRVQTEMNNILTFVEYFSKNLSYQFISLIKESVNLLGVDVPNVRKTIIDCFKNILMLAKAAEQWQERMLKKMARAEGQRKEKKTPGEDTDSAEENSTYNDRDNLNGMEDEEDEDDEEEEEEEDDETETDEYDIETETEVTEESKEWILDEKTANTTGEGGKQTIGKSKLNAVKKFKGRRNMKAFLNSSTGVKPENTGKNTHMNIMNKMLIHDERFLGICFDKCLRAREYSIYVLLTRQHDCKLHVRCHLLKILSELVEGDFLPVIYYNDLCLICRERINDKSPLVRQRAFSLLSSIATDVVKKKYMMPLDTERIKKDLELLITRKIILRKKAEEEKQKKQLQIKDTNQRTDSSRQTMESSENLQHNKILETKKSIHNSAKETHEEYTKDSNIRTQKKKLNLSGSDTDSDDEEDSTVNKKGKEGQRKPEIEVDTETGEQQRKTEENETAVEVSNEMSEVEKNIGKYDMVIQMYNDVLYIATLVDECVHLCLQLLYSVVETDQKSSIKFIILAHLCGNKLAGKQMNQVWSLIYSTNSVIVDIIIHEFLKVNIEPSDYRISAFRLINITLHSQLKDVSCIEKILQSILMQGKSSINIGKLLDELFKITFIDTFSENKNALIKEGGLILMKMICFSIYFTHKRRGDEVQYHTLFTEANMKDVMLFIKNFRNNFHFLNILALVLKYNETTRAVQYCMLALFNWLFLKLKLDSKHQWKPVESFSKNASRHRRSSGDIPINNDGDIQENETIATNTLTNTQPHLKQINEEDELFWEDGSARYQQKLKGEHNYLTDIRCNWFKFAQSVIEGMCEHFRTYNKLVARKMRLAMKHFFRIRRVVIATPKKIYKLSSTKRHNKYKLERRYRNNFTCFTLVKILFLYGHIGVYSLIHSEKVLNQLKDYPCEIDNFGMYTKDEQDREYFDFVVEEKIVCDNLLGKKIVPILFRIVRGPNTFYRKYALRKKNRRRWKLKKMLRRLQVHNIRYKSRPFRGTTMEFNDLKQAHTKIVRSIRKYISAIRRIKRKKHKARIMKEEIARRKRRKMLRKLELTLSTNIDKMSSNQITKILIRMKEIKRWRKKRKEKIIYRRYEMYLLFLVSLLSLCKYAIISLQFCKKKVTKRMTLIQLIVSVIVKEYKPIFSKSQRRDNFFKQGRVQVDSFGRITNLSLNSATIQTAEMSRAKTILFGTSKQQQLMERQRQRVTEWEQKQQLSKSRQQTQQLKTKKGLFAGACGSDEDKTQIRKQQHKAHCALDLPLGKERIGDMVKIKKNDDIIHMKHTLPNKLGNRIGTYVINKTGKHILIKKGKNITITKIIKKTVHLVEESSGKIVRKTIIKKRRCKRKMIGTVGKAANENNVNVRKVGRPPGRKVGDVLGKGVETSNKNEVVKEKKKRGRKPKPKDGQSSDAQVGIKVGRKRRKKNVEKLLRNKRKMKMLMNKTGKRGGKLKTNRHTKSKHKRVIDAQTYVMRKSVVNLRRMLLISYADLLYRHPNLLEPHNLQIFNVLSDKDVSIRKTAVAVFTHLYMTDTVKAKTVLLVHMMFLTADNDKKISSGAKSFFYELDRKAHNTLANNIADMITLVIKNERQWSYEKKKGVIEFLLYFMKKSKYSESLSEKIIRKMAEVELQHTEALNLYTLVFIHIQIDEKVLQRILSCIALIKHVIRENDFVYEKFMQVCKRAGEKRRGRPVDESQQQSNVRTASALYSEQGGKDFSERNEGKMKELADQLYCEVESAKQNVSAWSIIAPSILAKKRHSKGRGAWEPSPGKTDGTPKRKDIMSKKRESTPQRTDSTPKRMGSGPQRRDSTPKKRNSVTRKSSNFFNQLNSTPVIL